MLLSTTTAVLTTFIAAVSVMLRIVGSLVVLPSVSSPSSLISVTSFVFPGLLAFTVTELITEPLSAEELFMV